jgi:hypothetical protein
MDRGTKTVYGVEPKDRKDRGEALRSQVALFMDSDRTVIRPGAARVSPHLDPRRCVILVPFSTHIVPACEQGLIALQRRGYEVWRVGGYAAIDMGRSEWGEEMTVVQLRVYPMLGPDR